MSKKFLFTILLSPLFFLQSYAQDLSKIVDDVSVMMNDTAVLNDKQVSTDAPPIMSNKWNQIHTKFFTLNIGLCVLLDHVILVQDSNNIEQVGKVEPTTQFRADRIILSGNLLFFKKNPWHYMISANYNGLDAPQGKPTFDFTDWNIEIPFGKTAGWLTVGKQKEGVGLEYVSPGTQGMFTERGSGVPMIVRQRNIGVRYSNSVLNQRLAYTVGLFNNYWETGKSFSENGSQITARITGLPHYISDRELMHFGIGYRYTGSSDSTLSYKGKPEANTAPYFINTGSFAATSANTLMFEWIGVKGPVSLVGEYMQVFVNRNSNNGNPSFNYWQIGGSWFITGENRRYNKLSGNLGKLIPNKNFKFRKHSGPGAFELGARFTQSDFSDGIIQGGKFGRFTSALGWYPNAHFRFEINYGYGRLDKNKLVGKASFWQFRVQFEL